MSGLWDIDTGTVHAETDSLSWLCEPGGDHVGLSDGRHTVLLIGSDVYPVDCPKCIALAAKKSAA